MPRAPAWNVELRPLPQALGAALAGGLLLIGLGLRSAVQGHWGHALALLAILVICARGFWLDVALQGVNPPRMLERRADGGLWLHCAAGLPQPVILAPHSLCWGRCLLLVLRGSGTTRLWLGPGNLPAAVLAALRRELTAHRAGPPRPVA